MRLIFFIYILGFYSCTSHVECETINLDAFTLHQVNSKIPTSNHKGFNFNVYDKPEGNVIFNLPPDEEAGWGVTIVDQSENYFKIYNIWRQKAKALNYWENDWMSDNEYVWIDRESVGLNTKNYDQQTVRLYSDANINAKVLHTFDNVQTVVVHEVCNKWAYVKVKDRKGTLLIGWLSPEEQCSNPLSACH